MESDYEPDYKQQLIDFQREQLERYHEYMLIALSRGNPASAQMLLQPGSSSVEFKPLQTVMQENLENMPLDMMKMFFESPENNDHGIVALLESTLCPDKNDLNFVYHSSSSSVRYNNGVMMVTDGIQLFSKFVCDYIHKYCSPHIEDANEELRKEMEKHEEVVVDTLCKKNLYRVKHLSSLLSASEQVRLIKKLFSMLKNK